MRESMIGNKNAEIWSEEKSNELFDKAIAIANEYDDSTDTYRFDFIGEVARELGLYKEVFTNLKKRFPSLEDKHRAMVSTLEANCYYNTKRNKINTAVGIINLKSNHGWTDRADVTSKGETVNIPPMFGNNPLENS